MSYKLSAHFDGVIRLLDRAGIPNEPLNADWSDYQRWLAAGNTPQPADPIPPDDERDVAVRTQTIGAVQPKTIDQLKAMTLAEYGAWFDANFDTAAKLIGLLKRLTLIIIRRVL
jgi:hypothetical protein